MHTVPSIDTALLYKVQKAALSCKTYICMGTNGTNTETTMKVTRSEPVLVHPAEGATAEEYYYLSNLDQNIAVIMKTVHLFKASGERSSDSVVPVIKNALEKVLVHYYPYAGSLTISSEGKLAVRNDHHGVPFVEAVADCDLQVLGDISIPNTTMLGELIFVYPGAKNILETPLLTVQVTRFKCGGFVLGLAMNHCLADGVSAVEFLHSWAETARGLPLSIPPFIDRSIQRARKPPKVEFPHHEFTEIEDVSDIMRMYESEPVEYRSFTFDAEKMDRLKLMATEDGSVGGCSSFVALTAFIWRARTQALKMHPDQKSKLLFSVDGRTRVEPPLPAGFWGNAIVFACCVSTAQDLMSKPLSVAVQSIQDAVTNTNNAFIRSAIDYIEVTRARPSLTATLLVTSWTRLGFRTSNFGWGEAIQSGSAELLQKEVVVFLPHIKDSKSTVAVLGLPASSMQAFQDIVDLL